MLSIYFVLFCLSCISLVSEKNAPVKYSIQHSAFLKLLSFSLFISHVDGNPSWSHGCSFVCIQEVWLIIFLFSSYLSVIFWNYMCSSLCNLCSLNISQVCFTRSSWSKGYISEPAAGRVALSGPEPAGLYIIHPAFWVAMENLSFLKPLNQLIWLYEHQKSEVLLNGTPQAEENGNEKVNSQKNQVLMSRILANASTPSFHELYGFGANGSARRSHKCCVYIASDSKYCVRLNSIQAFSDINRDVSQLQSWSSLDYLRFLLVSFQLIWLWFLFSMGQIIGEASHLSGYSFSAHNNIIHPSAELGAKTTVSWMDALKNTVLQLPLSDLLHEHYYSI